MDASLRNTPALLNHIDKLTSQLVTRFLNIVDLSKPATSTGTNDDGTESTRVINQSQAASNTFRMDVETVALIRASEDILTLTRQMKEMWLFGQLNTLSESHAEEKTEEDARAVAALLQKLVDGQGQGVKPRA